MVKIVLIGKNEHTIPYNEIFREIPEVKISGCFDYFELIPENSKQVTIIPFGNNKKILNDSEAIVFVTGGKKYYKLVLQALKESKHVFLTHGIAENKFQAEQLIKLAGEANVIISLEQPCRYHAALSSVRTQFKNVRLIELHSQFANMNGHSHENLFRTIINDLDIIHTVVHSNIKDVKVCGIKMMNGNPDIINARLEFDNGSVANLNCSQLTTENVHYGTFTQQDRITKIDFLSHEVTTIKPERKNGSPDGNIELNPVTRKVAPNNPLIDELANFVFTISGKTSLLSNRDETFRSLYLTENIMNNLDKILID